MRPATNLLRHGIVFYVCTFVIISGDSHEEEGMEIHRDENRRTDQLLQKKKANFKFSEPCIMLHVLYVRNTNKMHNFLNNLFHLIYPRPVSSK